jgi:hypothetical protein
MEGGLRDWHAKIAFFPHASKDFNLFESDNPASWYKLSLINI